jgi:hypothetical protein
MVGRSVGRSQGSHTNLTLPLQFRHTGPPFPTLLHPAGHPQNGLKFWLVGWSVGWLVSCLVGRSVGHREVTRTSRCLIQFLQPGPPFPTLLCPAGHPQNGLKFWLVGWLVGRSWGSHRNVTLPLQLSHPGLPFPTLLRPAGHPQNGLEFWLVGWLVGWLVDHLLSANKNLQSELSPCMKKTISD